MTLGDSGLNTEVFGSHSVRHASTSAANRLGVSIDTIKKTAGWSGSSSTFLRFYNREAVIDTSDSFARSLYRSSIHPSLDE